MEDGDVIGLQRGRCALVEATGEGEEVHAARVDRWDERGLVDREAERLERTLPLCEEAVGSGAAPERDDTAVAHEGLAHRPARVEELLTAALAGDPLEVGTRHDLAEAQRVVDQPEVGADDRVGIDPKRPFEGRMVKNRRLHPPVVRGRHVHVDPVVVVREPLELGRGLGHVRDDCVGDLGVRDPQRER